jgi:hypothetical protein
MARAGKRQADADRIGGVQPLEVMVGTRYRRGADNTASAIGRDAVDDETLVGRMVV